MAKVELSNDLQSLIKQQLPQSERMKPLSVALRSTEVLGNGNTLFHADVFMDHDGKASTGYVRYSMEAQYQSVRSGFKLVDGTLRSKMTIKDSEKGKPGHNPELWEYYSTSSSFDSPTVAKGLLWKLWGLQLPVPEVRGEVVPGLVLNEGDSAKHVITVTASDDVNSIGLALNDSPRLSRVVLDKEGPTRISITAREIESLSKSAENKISIWFKDDNVKSYTLPKVNPKVQEEKEAPALTVSITDGAVQVGKGELVITVDGANGQAQVFQDGQLVGSALLDETNRSIRIDTNRLKTGVDSIFKVVIGESKGQAVKTILPKEEPKVIEATVSVEQKLSGRVPNIAGNREVLTVSSKDADANITFTLGGKALSTDIPTPLPAGQSYSLTMDTTAHIGQGVAIQVLKDAAVIKSVEFDVAPAEEGPKLTYFRWLKEDGVEINRRMGATLSAQHPVLARLGFDKPGEYVLKMKDPGQERETITITITDANKSATREDEKKGAYMKDVELMTVRDTPSKGKHYVGFYNYSETGQLEKVKGAFQWFILRGIQ